MVADVAEHLVGGKELWVAADDCLVFLAVIRVEDEIAQDLYQSVFCECAFYHREQRANAVGHLVVVIRLVPGVKVLIWCEYGFE